MFDFVCLLFAILLVLVIASSIIDGIFDCLEDEKKYKYRSKNTDRCANCKNCLMIDNNAKCVMCSKVSKIDFIDPVDTCNLFESDFTDFDN